MDSAAYLRRSDRVLTFNNFVYVHSSREQGETETKLQL